jgi:uncharacterized RDD family membrane protein YckC
MAALGITVLKNNVPWGPFTRAQIEDGLACGNFTVKYLAHAPGLKEWLPLGEVLDYVERSEGPRMPSLPPVPGPRELPPVPEPTSIPIPAPPASRPPILPASIPRAPEPPPPPIPPVVEKREIKPDAKPEARLTPAPFFLRGLAFLIDCAILFVPVAILFALGALAIKIPGMWNHTSLQTRTEEWELLKQNMWRLAWLVAIVCGWLYGAGLESSPSQATVGKRWMGLKVTDAHGERMSFPRATCRYAAKYLSALPCFLGFITALFSSRGLALHDRLTETRVVDSTRFHDTH